MTTRDRPASTSLPRAARRTTCRRRACAAALAAVLALGGAGSAHGWELVSALNAYGDHATGIAQPARNGVGVHLVVACEGDRWRSVVIAPPPGASFPLDGSGKVAVSFTSQPGPREQWQVRRRGKSRQVLYLAPVPSALVREMIGHADASPDATLHARVTSEGNPVTLEFSLAGLREAVRKDLWEPCKLGNQIPESDFDRGGARQD